MFRALVLRAALSGRVLPPSPTKSDVVAGFLPARGWQRNHSRGYCVEASWMSRRGNSIVARFGVKNSGKIKDQQPVVLDLRLLGLNHIAADTSRTAVGRVK